MRVCLLSLAMAGLLSTPLMVGDAFAQDATGQPPTTAPEAAEDEPQAAPPEQAPADPSVDGHEHHGHDHHEDDEDPLTGAPADDLDAQSGATAQVPLAEVRRYVGVFNAIRQGYVDPVDDRKLMGAAIRGLLFDLDPHSAYLDKESAAALSEDTKGAYDGIGVEVMQLPDGKVRIIAPIDDTPAAKAGIRAGDLIIAVDGRPLTPQDSEGHGPLRGPPGSKSMLTVVREGEPQPLQIEVQRETIRIASVRARMLEPGYGYVRISAFQIETADDFEREVRRLQSQSGGQLKGLVIDLRSNPGGLLISAVKIADALLEKGRIVSTRGRLEISEAEFNATPGDLLEGRPVVVVVDAGSASASEVLAGALGDNGRARVIGSRTFGKGSVQTVMPLGNGDSVKLTTARYYTPSGKSIQARGIDPDVVLKPDNASARPLSTVPGFTESTLPGHLRGDEEDGSTAGDVLPGEGPITAALAELKNPTAAAHAAPASPRRD